MEKRERKTEKKLTEGTETWQRHCKLGSLIAPLSTCWLPGNRWEFKIFLRAQYSELCLNQSYLEQAIDVHLRGEFGQNQPIIDDRLTGVFVLKKFTVMLNSKVMFQLAQLLQKWWIY